MTLRSEIFWSTLAHRDAKEPDLPTTLSVVPGSRPRGALQVSGFRRGRLLAQWHKKTPVPRSVRIHPLRANRGGLIAAGKRALPEPPPRPESRATNGPRVPLESL